MPLLRAAHWHTRAFHQYLAEHAHTPFAWGTNDCATFAAGGILAITGTDIMAELRGYSSGPGALQKIRDITGGATLADAVSWCAAKHGMTERQHALMAQRGDLVLYLPSPGELTAGLVHLSGRHVISPGEKGLQRFPVTLVQRSWTY